jgi:Tol biopolymer transport system component
MLPFRAPSPRLLAATLLGAALALSAHPAAAQYFGRNKVQYRTFDFQTLQTPHFDVLYYPEEEAAARDAARMAERWHTRLSNLLDHELGPHQPIVLYGSTPAFQQTTTLQGEIGEGTGGVTESIKQRVILPLTGSYQETDHVLGHELVHAFQYDISGLGKAKGNYGQGARALGTAPLWFVEGMAEYLSLGPVDPLTAMWMRDAVLTGNLPSVEQLTNDPRFFPYRWGQALWAYVGGRWGDPAIGQLLNMIGQGVPYEDAFPRVLSISLDDLFEDWHVSIRRSYLPMLAERPEAREVAKPLITPSKEGGQLNVGPAVSPDGQYVAFLSSLSNMDVELWLANAQTGEVIRKLRSGTAFDPHYQSLLFINSAGTFSPDGKQFVFTAQRGEHDVLVIINVRNGDVVKEASLAGVSELDTPTWSPDGRTIVAAGITGGVSDLYSYDVTTGESRRLTNDLYAQMHPAFSPDGRTIAFSTDQGGDTDLRELRYHGYRLALMDADGANVRIVPNTDVGRNLNPSWTRDGSALFFVSDRGGIPNIYRIDTTTGALAQITRLFGGVSGITATSPSISSARDADRLLFTAYEKSGYNIYSLTTQKELAGTPVTPDSAAATRLATSTGDILAPLPAQLPPVPRPNQAPFNRVLGYLHDAGTGLVTPELAASWPSRPYRPRLALDYLGQPQVGVSVGGVAGQGGLYGGISGVFSDLLGYHNLYGTVAAQGQLDEFGFQTMYLNQKNRWNWGAVAERIPYVSIGAGQISPTVVEIQRWRFFDTALQGLAQYPFSPVSRVEFTGGFRRMSQDVQVTDFDLTTGAVDRYTLPGSRSYNMAEASASLVYDNTLFGYTSPFAGQRYRFQVSPTVGQLHFVEALADYRRYQFLRPFTFAVQGLHFGRYAENAATDSLFYPIFLGEPSLVRGYYNTYSDCYNGDACDQALLNSLFGSRVLVAKAELRFPLIRALVVGPIGFPPIEGFGFFDAGTAWNQGNGISFSRGVSPNPNERGFLTSAGFGARVNLLGIVIVEADYVKAFEAVDKGWRWQFALQPGW